jgi:chromosome segregation ATPase
MALASSARAASVDPLGKVIELLTTLEAKVTADGDAEEKAYNLYFEWCDDTTKQQQYEIKTATAKKGKLEATISKASADIEASTGKIEDLAAKIATAEKELKDATLIREKETSDFESEEATLVETVDALQRAVGIIEKEMAKNPAAFLQSDISDVNSLISALSTITDAAGLDTATVQRLTAFVQQQASAEDEDGGAPDPAAYKTHSGGILDVLEDLKAKAEEELSALRKAESNTKHNYEMLKQSLEDEAAYNSKEKKEEEAFLADTEETKATATGDLAKTVALLEETTAALKSTQSECMKTAADHDASKAGRAEELKVLAEAKKILTETTSGAVSQTYDFLQVAQGSRLKTHADLKSAEVVRFMKKLARDQHSQPLAQLASRVAALMQFGARNGEDPFVKVKGLIQDMIEKLQKEADAAATEKAYCDEQMSKTEAKKSELEDDVAKLTAKIDTKSAKSTELKGDVKELQEELAALAKEKAEMDKVRAEMHAAFLTAQSDLELGLQGLSKALSKLRKYYQGEDAALLQTGDDQPAKPVFHTKASGAGGSIIDILEVCQSDFAKELSTIETEEADQVEAYEKRSQEIVEATALKSKDVKYKTQEFKGLDKEVDELTNDRTSTDEELSAVLEYYAKVKERCIAKPESYEERKARREAEITGLKEALRILSDETASSLLQARTQRRRSVQGFLTAR